MRMIRASLVPIEWHDGLSVYASESFLRAVGDQYGWLGGFEESGSQCCVLPFTVVRKAGLRMVRFRVETFPLGSGLAIDEERVFLRSAMAYFRSIGADLVIPASTNAIFRTYPEGAAAVPYGTYIVDLSQSEENLWGQVSASHRRQIRLAMKAGVQIRQAPERVEVAFELVRNTFGKFALPFMDLMSFKKYVAGLGDNVRIMIADYSGEVQGCIVVPFSAHSAYYVYGGSIPGAHPGAMHLMHWEAIRLFRGLGTKLYDFVGVRINPERGSKQEGLMMFKERFGGRLVEGFLWKYPIHPIAYRLYALAARLRSGGDIVDNELKKLARSVDVRREGLPGCGKG